MHNLFSIVHYDIGYLSARKELLWQTKRNDNVILLLLTEHILNRNLLEAPLLQISEKPLVKIHLLSPRKSNCIWKYASLLIVPMVVPTVKSIECVLSNTCVAINLVTENVSSALFLNTITPVLRMNKLFVLFLLSPLMSVMAVSHARAATWKSIYIMPRKHRLNMKLPWLNPESA